MEVSDVTRAKYLSNTPNSNKLNIKSRMIFYTLKFSEFYDELL